MKAKGRKAKGCDRLTLGFVLQFWGVEHCGGFGRVVASGGGVHLRGAEGAEGARRRQGLQLVSARHERVLSYYGRC